MAATAVTPPPLPPGAPAGVEAVRPGGPDRRQARDLRRRRAPVADDAAGADEPEPVRVPSGRLDVVA